MTALHTKHECKSIQDVELQSYSIADDARDLREAMLKLLDKLLVVSMGGNDDGVFIGKAHLISIDVCCFPGVVVLQLNLN